MTLTDEKTLPTGTRALSKVHDQERHFEVLVVTAAMLAQWETVIARDDQNGVFPEGARFQFDDTVNHSLMVKTDPSHYERCIS